MAKASASQEHADADDKVGDSLSDAYTKGLDLSHEEIGLVLLSSWLLTRNSSGSNFGVLLNAEMTDRASKA